MSHTVQLERIQFVRSEERGEDGSAWYLILSPCPGDPPGEPCRHVCGSHPRMKHEYERQGFRLGSSGYRPNATPQEIAEDKANVWGWDGNRERPTLSPSFLAKAGRDYLMHSYIHNGEIELCSDSTVTLHPQPVPCKEMP